MATLANLKYFLNRLTYSESEHVSLFRKYFKMVQSELRIELYLNYFKILSEIF
jgi:hypothetical protein